MANIIIPHRKTWLNKPPVGSTIDWGHPLSQKLVACWLMNERAGGIIKDIARGHTGRFSGVSAPLWKPSRAGMCLFFDNVDDDIPTVAESVLLCEGGPLTIFAVIKPNATPGGDANAEGRILGKGGTGFTIFEFQNQAGLDNCLLFQKDYATTDLLRRSADNTLTQNVQHLVLVTWDGSATATGIHIYINGLETTYQTTTNGVGAENADATGIWHIGNNATPGIRDFPGGIATVMLWKRVLTPSEVRYFSSNPYQFIQPYKRVIYFTPATGAIDVIVTPNALSARIVPQSPTIRTDCIVSLNAISSRVVPLAPSVKIDNIASVNALSSRVMPLAPTISVTGDVVITPSVITNRIIVQSPTIKIDAVISAGVITSKVTLLSPSIKIDAVITISTLSNRILSLSPSVRIDALISAGILSNRIITQSPSVKTDIALALSVLQERLLLYAPTITVSGIATGIADVIRLASAIEQIITRQSQMSQLIVRRSKMEKIIMELSGMDKTITKKSRIEQVIKGESPIH